jgi:predicted NBD/HSP70 family sugar kinase
VNVTAPNVNAPAKPQTALTPPGEAEPAAVVAGRPQLLRAMNEEILLSALRRSGPLRRNDLARLSGLSKPTVGLGLANLERAGLVRLAGHRAGERGPAAVLYEVNPGAGYVLALDVGREYVRGALADLAGNARARARRGVHSAGGHGRVAQLAALATELSAQAGVPPGDLTEVVVGSPGVYDARRDVLSLAAGLPGWEHVGVLSELRRALGPEMVVENDVNLATLAERDLGHGRGVPTFAFVSVGTGIGMGLVLDGRLHKGAHGAAGEIGFLPIDGDSPGDRADDWADARRRGRLEAAASAAGVVRAARRAGLVSRLSARQVFEAAAAGDEVGASIVAHEANLVARAVAAVTLVADPDLVVLGGGIGGAPGFAEAVAEELALLVPAAPPLRVSAMGAEATVDGGLRLGIDLAWRRLLDRG